MSKRTLILIVALLGVTALLLFIALSSKLSIPGTQQSQKSVTPSYAKSSLTIDQPTRGANGTYNANVMIDTGGNKVTAVQLELAYDTAHLTNVSIQQGNFFQNPTQVLKKISEANGTVSYALSGASQGVSGTGIVATLTFNETGNAGDSSFIKFTPKTVVNSSETPLPVLKSTLDTNFTIESSGQSTSTTNPPVNTGTTSAPVVNY